MTKDNTKASCIEFLRWALPRLDLRWDGFRKVHGQVCKRLNRRLLEINLNSWSDYQKYLIDQPEEWKRLDQMCQITISRFYRDRGVFDFIKSSILPQLRLHNDRVNIWSIGCASGEEPYTIALIWNLTPGISTGDARLNLLATDVNTGLITRAKQAAYPRGCLRELPDKWIEEAFMSAGDDFQLKDQFKKGVRFKVQDIRYEHPDQQFDLVLCRNLVFTYFNLSMQNVIGKIILKCLRPGGFFVVGSHEDLPESLANYLEKWSPAIYRKKDKLIST